MDDWMKRKNRRCREKGRWMQKLLSIALTVLMIGVYPLEAFAYEPVMEAEEETAKRQTAAAGEKITINGVVFEVIDASANTLRVVGYTSNMPTLDPLGDDGGYEGKITYSGTTYTITEVADGAFKNSNVEYIAFPVTITSFGKGVLDGCSNLKTVENCSSVATLELPELEFGYVWWDSLTQKAYTSILGAGSIAGGNVCVQKTKKNVYEFTFNSQGGSEVTPNPQKVMEGGYIQEPEAPTREGYIFKGWYNGSSGDPFDFSTQITNPADQNLSYTMYAKWVEVKEESDFIALQNGYQESVTFKSKENKWYRFTPAVSGTYQMATGSTNVRINYYGTDYSDLKPQAPGFNFSGEMEAGKTYYFRLYNNAAGAKTTTLTFKSISATAISDLAISGISASYVYTGSTIEPAVTVKDGTTTLVLNTDYTVSYSNNVNAGTATVTIKAAGDKYYGSITKNFTILQAAAPSSVPASSMEVSSNVETVSGVSLAEYPNWSWQSAYKTQKLVSGGTVTAVAEYTGKDKANYKQTTVTVSITRLKPVVTDFTLNATGKALKGGETFTLAVASVTPADADSSMVTYSSNNKEVATVGADGKITAKKSGTAVITAKLDAVSKTCTVSVTNPVSDFKLTRSDVSLSGGKTVTLNVTSITPVNYDDYSVVWSSDKESVAAVRDGVVTARATGTASITAVINGIARSCTVVVTNPLTDFALDKTTMALKGGETGQLNLTFEVPANPDAYTVSWSSSDVNVAVVTDGSVQAKGTGTAKITATVNGVSKTCTVTVTNPCTAFELNTSEITLIAGNPYTLFVTSTTPEKADAYTVKWTSDNSEVVTVSSENADVVAVSGELKALQAGTATITAELTSAAGTIKRTCKVTVIAATETLTDIAVEPGSMNLKAGETGVIQVTPVPEGAALGTITYASANPGVAEVDNTTGKVTAKTNGTTVIRITAGGFMKECSVTVTNPVVSFSLNKTVTSITEGDTETLVVTTTPANPDAYTVNWTSDNTSVATVDSNGKVSGKSAGTAVITATINGIQRQCTVKVEEKAAPTCTVRFLDESGNEMEQWENLTQGSTINLPAISPRDGYTLEWKNKVDGGLYAQGASFTVTGDMEFVVNAQKIAVSSVTLDSTVKTIVVDESFVLDVTVKPDNAFDGSVSWSSSDTGIARVDSNGRVTGVALGTAVIRVTAKDGSGKYAECSVTVTDSPNPLVDFSLNKTEISIAAGGTETLVITTTPANPDAYAVNWESNNTSVATVDNNGTVSGISAGTAVVTATINGIQKQCTVRVEENTAVTYTVRFLDESNGELEKRENLAQGSTINLPAITPRKGYTLEWKNNADGVLYTPGTSVIVTGDMEFVVNARKIAVSSVTLNSTNKTIAVNESFVLGTTVKPDNAFDRSISWSSSNTRIAVVDSNGKVTGIAAGTAVIKAAAKDGSGKYAECSVTVREPEPEYIAVKGLKITGSTKKVAPGKKITLKVNVSPANADNQQVVWKVSNNKYASVNSKGVVTTKKAGKGKKVTVTAVSAENGSITATYKISIMKNAVKKIKLTGKTTLKKGKSTTLKAKFTPSKNISKELTWTSSNKKIATVSSKGKVTAKKKGKVKITAKAKDGSGKKATITIRVK